MTHPRLLRIEVIPGHCRGVFETDLPSKSTAKASITMHTYLFKKILLRIQYKIFTSCRGICIGMSFVIYLSNLYSHQYLFYHPRIWSYI